MVTPQCTPGWTVTEVTDAHPRWQWIFARQCVRPKTCPTTYKTYKLNTFIWRQRSMVEVPKAPVTELSASVALVSAAV